MANCSLKKINDLDAGVCVKTPVPNIKKKIWIFGLLSSK